MSTALQLAEWAYALQPTDDDRALARRALLDTVAVALAARGHRVHAVSAPLSEAARWAVAAHVLDFDDLHLPSTAHLSAVCVPATLAAGGDARAYLAGAGVMARLGTALGWSHYTAGWHTTCTAGAPGAAVAAAVSMGLDVERTVTALALAVPAAGGVQRAFGTDAKSLQVGFAVEAGLRAARLAAAGATADPSALDAWLGLVQAETSGVDLGGPAVPDGLAIKLYPACYALQRPISALASLTAVDPNEVVRVVVTTPEPAVVPLIHRQPTTGLQGKFSLEYALAAALLDRSPNLDSFTDAAVQRPAARRLMAAVDVHLVPGGEGLLDGDVTVEVHTRSGDRLEARMRFPPGSPQVPPTERQLGVKLSDCLRGLDLDPPALQWHTAADALRRAERPPSATTGKRGDQSVVPSA